MAAAVGSWASALARAVVLAALVALAGLLVLCLVPQAFGLRADVVVSGSMQPRIAPGDVVLTAPVTPQELEPGQVLLFRDPADPGRTLLHRLVAFDARGDLVTRGDANQGDDPSPVPAAEVVGRAHLRVPHVGLPAYWWRTGDRGAAVLATALLAGVTVWATRRHGTGPEPARPGRHRTGPWPVPAG
ncbi:signal peptidase I [Modestobacter sp. VKM Ac-2986]|uniref:signal peptidase I n=1 Tax=Modestobacter sp. VKM Ac-2986 TaxID=3004140 RepID=UPI0022ABAA2D|nr:signal peptidase I [Modestobacter sp. VKM Ac-2986]MCZ2830194.1 signal peptidase I [Modestobacter sp. VKM Ac-2986]